MRRNWMKWWLMAIGTFLGIFVWGAPLSAQTSPTAEALARLQAEDWEGARAAFRAIVDETPSDGLSWLRLGRALTELGREEEAIKAIDRAAEAQLQTPFVQIFKARALVRLELLSEALDVLESIPPSPAVGGAATFGQTPDFVVLAGDARYQALMESFDNAAYPCRNDPVNREFDFWIGTWDVTVQGQPAGVNRIELMLEGCTLQENWTNVGSRSGKSFNWVDRSSFGTPSWRQLWVDDSGNTLDYYRGHYADGAMRFEGHTINAEGDSILQRLTFENLAPDTVRQTFLQSTDSGTSWTQTWQGLYVRRPEG